MPRYIDADKMIDGYSTTFPYDITYCDDGDLMEWINNQPTADVVPRSEVERLQKECEITRAYIHNNGLEWGLVSHLEFYKNQRAEAIKEFAERLKAEINELMWAYPASEHCERIDNLVKEMEKEK